MGRIDIYVHDHQQVDAGEEHVGKLVKFLYPTLQGPKPRTGTVKRVLPSGKLEVKLQLGGYHEISSSEIIP